MNPSSDIAGDGVHSTVTELLERRVSPTDPVEEPWRTYIKVTDPDAHRSRSRRTSKSPALHTISLPVADGYRGAADYSRLQKRLLSKRDKSWVIRVRVERVVLVLDPPACPLRPTGNHLPVGRYPERGTKRVGGSEREAVALFGANTA
jgi:hypothetical protein